METTFFSWSHELNLIIDIWPKKTAPFIIYIPWMRYVIKEMDYLALAFNEAGFNFVRFDFPYHKEWISMDDFSLSDDISVVEDLMSELDRLFPRIAKIWIIAKSFWWVKWFLFEDERLFASAFIAPAAFFSEGWNISKISDIKYSQISNIRDINLDSKILEDIKVPVCVAHSKDDEVVPFSNSEEILERIKQDKEFLVFSDASHSFKSYANKEKLQKGLISFFEKNLAE